MNKREVSIQFKVQFKETLLNHHTRNCSDFIKLTPELFEVFPLHAVTNTVSFLVSVVLLISAFGSNVFSGLSSFFSFFYYFFTVFFVPNYLKRRVKRKEKKGLFRKSKVLFRYPCFNLSLLVTFYSSSICSFSNPFFVFPVLFLCFAF